MAVSTVVWNEFIQERDEPVVRAIYPDGIHSIIAQALATDPALHVSTATLDQPEHGLPQTMLDQTDVLLWREHRAPGKVSDEVTLRVQHRVAEGHGIDALA
jgi:trehalose utilization protein